MDYWWLIQLSITLWQSVLELLNKFDYQETNCIHVNTIYIYNDTKRMRHMIP
jgi:hypothetical protein